MRKHLGIRQKLTVLYAVVFGLTTAIFAMVLYKNFVNMTEQEFDAALYNHGIDLSKAVTVDVFGNLNLDTDQIDAGDKIFPFSVGRSFAQFVSSDGRVLARSTSLGRRQINFTSSVLKTALAQGVVFSTEVIKEQPHRLMTLAVNEHVSMPFFVQVMVPMNLMVQELTRLRLFLLITIPLALLLSTILGFFMAGRALAPVVTMTETLKKLDPAKLDQRVPVSMAKDEIQELSVTVNSMLERLQNAFEGQERFVADASHELKTPLAILRGELDVFRSRTRTQDEEKEFLDSTSQELLRLSHLVDQMLLLARLDAGVASLSAEMIRLDEICLEVIARVQVLAKQKNIRIRFDMDPNAQSFEWSGDSLLIRSLVGNLIDNAIKYSPNDSSVDVRLDSRNRYYELTVQDEGGGIAESLREKIFQRFFRKTWQHQGAGLGLAIVKRVADVHKLQISVENAGPGACFSVKFPTQQA